MFFGSILIDIARRKELRKFASHAMVKGWESILAHSSSTVLLFPQVSPIQMYFHRAQLWLPGRPRFLLTHKLIRPRVSIPATSLCRTRRQHASGWVTCCTHCQGTLPIIIKNVDIDDFGHDLSRKKGTQPCSIIILNLIGEAK